MMIGKPVFKEARITVEHVLNEHSAGMDEAKLLGGHPRLTSAHIPVVLAYAAAVIGMEEIIYA